MGKKEWWKEAVVYQIYPRSFKDSTGSGEGDLKGIISKLDYLEDLGIDVIWLSPVYASPMVDNGYDISNYEAINPLFGSMADFDEMLSEAHKRSIKIVMDLVVNHSSNEHPWFIESRSSKDNPKRDWYIWRDGFNGGPPNQLRSVFSGSAWQFDKKTAQYYLHLFDKVQPDLNWDNPAVRNAVYRMMKFWFDKGIDGFRMDVISMISKFPATVAADGGKGANICNGPRVHEYLEEMNKKVLSHYDIMTVGEAAGVTIDEAKRYANAEGTELNMVFQFEHMGIDEDAGTGKWTLKRYRLQDLKKVLSAWETELEGKAWNSLFWDNHDQPRAVSRFGDDSTEELRQRSAKMLAVCLHMMKGTPYIYQGEELGMTNAPIKSLDDCRDVEIFNAWKELVEEKKILSPTDMLAAIAARGRDNARTPMQWDDSLNAGFSTGKPWIPVNPNCKIINAAAQVKDPVSVYSFYKKLIRLRKEYPVIVHGDYEILLPDDERLWIYRRHYEGKTLLTVCNFSGGKIPRPSEAKVKEKLLISNYDSLSASEILPWEGSVYLY
ncbi:MAG: alpha-glucosidase [Treponema sp.]|jgi:oligo-1,6-glucosidase|nr:alpha-glucosidase [Treponema sp.]